MQPETNSTASLFYKTNDCAAARSLSEFHPNKKSIVNNLICRKI